MNIGCPRPCRRCGKCCCVDTERRVYFGAVGPFCNVECREVWLGDDSKLLPMDWRPGEGHK